MKKNTFLILCVSVLMSFCLVQAEPVPQGLQDRAYWVSTLDKIAKPVLVNMSQNKLKEKMPIVRDMRMSEEYSAGCAHLEAFGRLIQGMAPWLELGPDESPEGLLRASYLDLTLKSLKNAVDPEAADFLNYTQGTQPLVDAAFLAQAVLRAPTQLWGNLDAASQQNLITQLKATRCIKPWPNNWLLFSAMIEVALLEYDGQCNEEVIYYAMDTFFDKWYMGDSFYSDGKSLHLDYYNSYVIHPMMVTIIQVMEKHKMAKWQEYKAKEMPRFVRHAAILERLIAPDGSFPLLGRSIIYRYGAFQCLADVALQGLLPKAVSAGQVRSALTAVIKRQTVANTFDEEGWLVMGFVGDQYDLIEIYSCTGSLYACSHVFLPLGLPATDAFWTMPAEDWTQKKAWSQATGLKPDHALD